MSVYNSTIVITGTVIHIRWGNPYVTLTPCLVTVAGDDGGTYTVNINELDFGHTDRTKQRVRLAIGGTRDPLGCYPARPLPYADLPQPTFVEPKTPGAELPQRPCACGVDHS